MKDVGYVITRSSRSFWRYTAWHETAFDALCDLPPSRRVVNVAVTRWGARRVIARDRRKRAADAVRAASYQQRNPVVERIEE